MADGPRMPEFTFSPDVDPVWLKYGHFIFSRVGGLGRGGGGGGRGEGATVAKLPQRAFFDATRIRMHFSFGPPNNVPGLWRFHFIEFFSLARTAPVAPLKASPGFRLQQPVPQRCPHMVPTPFYF